MAKNNLTLMTKEEFYDDHYRFFYNSIEREKVNDENITTVVAVVEVSDLSEDSLILAAGRALSEIDFSSAIKNKYFIRFAFGDRNGGYLNEETFFKHIVTIDHGEAVVEEILDNFFSFIEPPNYGTGSDYYYDEETSALGFAIKALIEHDIAHLGLATKFFGNIVDWEHDDFCQNLISSIDAKLGTSKEGIDFGLTVNLNSWAWTENPSEYFLDRIQEDGSLAEWIQERENRDHVRTFIRNFDSLGINHYAKWFDDRAEEILDALTDMFGEEATPDTGGSSGTKVITKESFRSKGLTRAVIEDGTEIIEEMAFYGNDLEDLIIPDSVKRIGNSAFAHNQLSSVTISAGLRTIEEKVFTYNELRDLTIPAGIQVIGEAAFYRNALETVVIPGTVHTIAKHAFTKNSIENLIIENGVRSIDDFAFENNRLSEVTIPESVVEIGYQAFGDNKIKSVTIEGDETRFNDDWKRIGFPQKLMPKGDRKVKTGTAKDVQAPKIPLDINDEAEDLGKDINERYYIALALEGDAKIHLSPDEKTAGRGYHYEKQSSGQAPFFFHNAYPHSDGSGPYPITDVLFDGGYEFLVRDFIRDELEKFEINGLQLYPAVYIDDADNWHENYWFLIFHENKDIDFLDKEKSLNNDKEKSIERYRLNDEKFNRIPLERRLVFRLSSEFDSQVFVHEKVVRFFEQNGFSGIRFVKTADFKEGDQYNFDKANSDVESYENEPTDSEERSQESAGSLDEHRKPKEDVHVNLKNESFDFSARSGEEQIEVTFFEQNEGVYAQVLDLIADFLRANTLEGRVTLEATFTEEMPYLEGYPEKTSANQFFCEVAKYPALHGKIVDIFNSISAEDLWVGEEGRYNEINLGTFIAVALSRGSAEHLDVLHRWLNTLGLSYNQTRPNLHFIEDIFDKYKSVAPAQVMDIVVRAASLGHYDEKYFPKDLSGKILNDPELTALFFESLLNYENENQADEYALRASDLVDNFFPNYKTFERYIIFCDEHREKHPGKYQRKFRGLDDTTYERKIRDIWSSRERFEESSSPDFLTTLNYVNALSSLLNYQVNETSIHLAEELQETIIGICKEHEQEHGALAKEYANGFKSISMFYVEKNRPEKVEEQIDLWVDAIVRNEPNRALTQSFLEVVYELLALYEKTASDKIDPVVEKAVRVGEHYTDPDDFREFFFEHSEKADEIFARVGNSPDDVAWARDFNTNLQVAFYYYHEIFKLAALVYRKIKSLEKEGDDAVYDFTKKWIDLILLYYSLTESHKDEKKSLDFTVHPSVRPFINSSDDKLTYGNLRNYLNAILITAFDNGKIEEGIAIADSIQEMAYINSYIYHSAACLYVAGGRNDTALEQCTLAKKYGYPHMATLKTDTDLEELFELEEFKKL